MRTACHHLVCLAVCVPVTLVVFIDCESCAWPISTNPRSIVAGECGQTRGTCFVARRLEVVDGLPWISWCVLSGADFFVVSFFDLFFPFERTRPAASMSRLASFTSLLVLGGSLDSKMARTSTLTHADSLRTVLWGCSLFIVPDGIRRSSRGG